MNIFVLCQIISLYVPLCEKNESFKKLFFFQICLFFLISYIFKREHFVSVCMVSIWGVCDWRQKTVNKRWKVQKDQCLISSRCSPHQCLFILFNMWDMKGGKLFTIPPSLLLSLSLSLSLSLTHTHTHTHTLHAYF